MNIFAVSEKPADCAAALDNSRVNNQIRETAQLLCTALRVHGCDDPRLMRQTHVHHPVTKWVCLSLSNWLWTYDLFRALALEKRVRWPDNDDHKSWVELRQPLLDLSAQFMPDGPQTPFVNCAARRNMHLDFTDMDDVHEAYRSYLVSRWVRDVRTPRWSNRGSPDWAPFDKVFA